MGLIRQCIHFVNLQTLPIKTALLSLLVLLLSVSILRASSSSSVFATRTVNNTQHCSGNPDYVFWLKIDGESNYHQLEAGQLIEYADGTARLTMTARNVDDPQIRWDIDALFSGRTFGVPSGSPKAHICLSPDESTWYYYTSTSGTITGLDKVAGARISLDRAGPSFQIGYGANQTDEDDVFGASGWMHMEVLSQPSTGYDLDIDISNDQEGDFNLRLSGSPLSPRRCTPNVPEADCRVREICDITSIADGQLREFWTKDDSDGLIRKYRFQSPAQLQECTNGEAYITGVVANVNNTDDRWEVYIKAINKRNWSEWSALGRNYYDPLNTGHYADWSYYEIDPSSKWYGLHYNCDQELDITHRPADYSKGLQIGQGANGKTTAFGLSSWFGYSGGDGPLTSGEMDINAELENCETQCDNVTEGGEIGVDETLCTEFNDPAEIYSVTEPSGGQGDIEYIWWESTTSNIPPASMTDPDWTLIAGANGPSYDPGPITQTTYYVRCARRTDCEDYEGESNLITKEMIGSCGRPAPEGWEFSCEDGIEVDILGEGIRCDNNKTITVPNIGNVTQIIAEVVYKGTSINPSTVTFNTPAESSTVSGSFTDPAKGYCYRTTLSPAGSVSLNTIANKCNAQSFVLYVFRNTGNSMASSGVFVEQWLYHDSHCETLHIPRGANARDVLVTIPLSEITNDGRVAIVTASAVGFSGIEETITIDNYNQGDALNISTLTLRNVPAKATSISVCVESPNGTTPDGQSFVFAGAIKADPVCTSCEDSDLSATTAVTSDYNDEDISCPGASDGRVAVQASGGLSPYTYLWSNGHKGPEADNLSAGTYSVTVSDDFGCTTVISEVILSDPPALSVTASVSSSYNEGVDISTQLGTDGAVIASATGGTGNYTYQWDDGGAQNTQEATGLSEDTYTVTVTDENGCTATAQVTLKDPAKLGNFAWEDRNGNGLQDDGEPGIPDVEITLSGTADNGNPVNRQTTTGSDGMYMFDGLPKGTYKITVGLPAGYTLTPEGQGSDPSKDSDIIPLSTMSNSFTLDDAEYRDDLDVGIFRPATIGNYVWLDTNGDGLQNEFATGIEGVNVRLSGTDGAGNPVDQLTRTDINGIYFFAGLLPGEYKISFETPADHQATAADQGGDDSRDSDADPVTGMTESITLASGDNYEDFDAGYYKPGSLGDFVWDDLNGNGVQDNGEPGIADVDISLSGVDGAGQAVNLSTTTDAGGAYLFDNLAPGTYKLTFATPADYRTTLPGIGGNAALDSDIDLATGMTINYLLTSGMANKEVDAGFFKYGEIGNFAWLDCNKNGQQDPGEAGLAFVPMVLNGTDGNGQSVNQTTATDESGHYLFEGLWPGTYQVTFGFPGAPNGLARTAQDQGTDDAKDSDADASGTVPGLTLESGDWIDQVDAGYTDIAPPALAGVPSSIEVECNEIPEPPVLYVDITASDNLDENVEIILIEESDRGPVEACSSSRYTLTRTWTATDDCGNSVSQVQTITVRDTKAPEFVDFPSDITVECSEVPQRVDPELRDQCESEASVSFDEQVIPGECGESYTLKRSWTVSDACGNEQTGVQLITVVDQSKPVFSFVPANLTIECSEVPSPGQPAVEDNCDADLDIEFAERRIDGACPNSYELIRSWTATDNCGNTQTATQVITVLDQTPPVFSFVPADLTVECDEVPDAGTPTAEDNCDVNSDIAFAERRTEGGCNDSYTLTRIWTATDACGNTRTAAQVITVRDTKGPELSGVPADLTVECDEVPQPAVVTASDPCDGSVEVEFRETRTDGSCGDNYTLIRIWTATDDCGNQSSAQQIINVNDNSIPQLIGVPADARLACDEVPDAPVVTASDNCDGTLAVEFSEIREDGNCPGSYILRRTWTVTDQCGNSVSAMQEMKVEDTTSPRLVGVPSDGEVECDEVPLAPQLYATDNCDAEVEVTMTERIITQSCPDSYILERSWVATDDCGNQDIQIQKITVRDQTGPTLVNVPADATVLCDEVPEAPLVNAQDNCDGDVQVDFSERKINGECLNSYTLIRSWIATDNCGNTRKATQTITVEDQGGPVASNIPADVTVECDEIPPVQTPEFEDGCDENVNIVFSEIRQNGSCESEYTVLRKWSATDNCGNSSVVTQTIKVQDTSKPSLSTGPANVTVACNEVPVAAVLTATDNCDNQVEVEYSEVRQNGACDEAYQLTRTWKATDDCGNVDVHTQLIKVTDAKAPVFTAVAADVTVECDEVPERTDPQVADNCTELIELAFNEERENGSCNQSYTLKRIWTATDNCGNVARTEQIITVRDTRAPELLGVPSDVVVACHEVPDPAQVTAADGCEESLNVEFSETRQDGNCDEFYTLTRKWTVRDNCGNIQSATQIIKVQDTGKPSLVGIPADVTVECDEVPEPPLVSATDDCDAEVDIEYAELLEEGSCSDRYTLRRQWIATDNCGNSSVATQLITIGDTKKPELTGVPADLSVSCDEVPEAPVVNATDNCAGELTVEFSERTAGSICDDSYVLIREWAASDACGNRTSATQKITVSDNKAPTFDNPPANIEVQCGEVPSALSLTATDNCDDAVEVVFNEVIQPGSCGHGYTIIRTWIAADNCGNNTVVTQLISVSDDTSPVLTGVPSNVAVSCQEIPAPPLVTASDNCDATIEVVYAERIEPGDCTDSYGIIRSWSATDDCGNETVETQRIIVSDADAPALSGVPADVTVSCDEVPEAPNSVGASDLCDEAPVIDFSERTEAGDCAGSYLLIRSWTATDACGNSRTASQRIVVQDVRMPEFSSVPANVEVACDEVPAAAQLVATDNCGGTVSVDFAERRIDGDCPNNYDLIRSWTASDDCGNTTVVSQTISVRDTRAPVLSGVPSNVDASCEELPEVISVTAADNCDGEVIIEFEETQLPGACAGAFTIIRVWTATDQCGNAARESQTISVGDNSAPVITGVPSNIEVECDEVPEPAIVSVTDDCVNNLTPEFEERIIEGNCPDSYTLIRTWRATDDCGNRSEESQTIKVRDSRAPILNGLPSNVTIDLTGGETLPPVATVTATDNCDPNVSPEYSTVEIPSTDGGCSRKIYRTWTVTDRCGNRNSMRQVITVLDFLEVSFNNHLLEACVGQPLSLSANVAGSNLSYLWSADGGSFDNPSLANPTFTADAAGTYRVSLTITNGNCSGQAQIQIQLSDGPDVAASSNGPVCLGQDLQLFASDGASAYSWTGPGGFSSQQQNPVIPNATEAVVGEYFLSVSFGSCTVEASTTVEIGDEFAVNLSHNSSICDGDTLRLSVDAGNQFEWTGPNGFRSEEQFVEIPNASIFLNSGIYTVRVISSSGCQRTLSVPVEITRPPIASAYSNSPVCLEEELLLFGNGGVTYEWNGPNGYRSTEMNPVISDLTGFGSGMQIFSLTVTSLDGCEHTTEIEVKVQETTGFEVEDSIAFCPGENILLSATTLGDAEYNWTGPNGFVSEENNPVINNAVANAAGEYTLRVFNGAGCDIQRIVNVRLAEDCGECRLPLVSNLVVVKSTCGEANGSVAIELVGDEAGYTYTWAPELGSSNATGHIRSGLPAGNYGVTISDPRNTDCATTLSVNVGAKEGPVVSDISTVAAACGSANGSARIEPAEYEYTWLADDVITDSRSDLAAGVYEVKVVQPGAGNCPAFISITIEEENNLSATANILQQPECGLADGRVRIEVEGGSGDYSFSWGTGPTRTNLAAGSYGILVTDLNSGCTTSAVFTLLNSGDPLTIDITNIPAVSCAGQSDGRVSYTATSDNGISFEIRNSNGQIFENGHLPAGDYCLVALDAEACWIGKACFEVSSPAALALNLSITDQSCENQGSISLGVDGGSGSYTYDWADLERSNDPGNRSGLAAGSYSLTVTDEKGCSAVATELIVEDECIPLSCEAEAGDLITGDDELCLDNGFVTLGASLFGATVIPQGYQVVYLLSRGENLLIEQLSLQPQFVVFSTGGYSIHVLVYDPTSANPPGIDLGVTTIANLHQQLIQGGGEICGALNMDGVEIEVVDCGDCEAPVVSSVAVIQATCGNSDGGAIINLANENNYSYSWSPVVSTSNRASNLEAGTYFVTISDPDRDLCFTVESFTIGNADGPAATVTTTAAGCLDNNGTAILTPANYSYSWSDGKTGNYRDDLLGKSYQVTLSDGSACTNVITVDVPQTSNLQATAVVDQRPDCGQANGQVRIDVEGGSGNYLYSWGPGNSRSDLAAGSYAVQVVEIATGCSTEVLFTLLDDVAPIEISIESIRHLSCPGAANGRVNFSTTPSAGSSTVIVDEAGQSYDNGQLRAGWYCLQVRNAEACLAGESCFEIVAPKAIEVDLSIVPAACETKGRISLTPNDEQGNLIYDWADLPGADNPGDRNNLAPGNYELTIRNDQGCQTHLQELVVRNNCITGVTPDTIPLILMVNTSAGICVPLEEGFNLGTTQFVLADGSLNGSSTFGNWTLEPETGCLKYTAGSNPGNDIDLICIRAISNGVEDITCIRVTITREQTCKGLGIENEAIVTFADCGGVAEYCLRVPVEEISLYQLTDNNRPYTGGIGACGIFSGSSYSYYLIPGTGVEGPYRVDPWTVNGMSFSGIVQDVDALVDSMNVWDPSGNWVKDGSTLRIIGGNMESDYGAIRITQIASNQIGILNISAGVVSAGTQLNFTEGEHLLILTQITTGCRDSVRIEVLCEENCKDIYSGPNVITAPDCNAKAALCLDINPVNILDYEITDNGSAYTGKFNGCNFDTVISYLYFTVPDRGEKGPYLLESWKIGNQVFSTEFQTIRQLVDAMNVWDPRGNWMLNTTSFTISGTDQGKQYGDMMIRQLNTGSVSPEISPNLQFLPFGTALELSAGIHELMIRNTKNGCVYQIDLVVTCGELCAPVYEGPTTISSENCETLTPVCLDINPLELANYSITDNGAAYAGDFNVCNFDTVVSYLYFTIPDRGAAGPYVLESWKIGNQVFSTTFQNVPQLVDSMNVWDPSGDWTIEPTTYTIQSKDASKPYGDMRVLQVQTGARSPEISPNLQFLPFGTLIQLSKGQHELIISHEQNGCQDTLDLTIECRDDLLGKVIDTLIYVGETDTFCLDLSELGSISGINNLCAEAAYGHVEFGLIAGTTCVQYTGVSAGRDTFCLRICDVAGRCDTTSILINVLPARIDADTIRRSVLIGQIDTVCVSSADLQGEVMRLTNACAEASGVYVDFIPLEGSSCIEFAGDALGTEQACVVICDSLQNCDTTILIVSVVPPSVDTVVATVVIDSTLRFCLDTTELSGAIDTMYNYCPQTSGTNAGVSMVLDSLCIEIEGRQLGQDTACIILCDDRQICDTTIYLLNIVAGGMPPVAMDDDTMTIKGTPVTVDVLENDTNSTIPTVTLINTPRNGTAIVNTDLSVTYNPTSDFCGEVDSFTYVLSNTFGADTAMVYVEVLCDQLTIFSGFSPNGDGINEVFTILGIESFPQNNVCVFNRWGNRVFQKQGYKNTWDGTLGSKVLPDGTYFYVIDDGEGKKYSGYVQIQR